MSTRYGGYYFEDSESEDDTPCSCSGESQYSLYSDPSDDYLDPAWLSCIDARGELFYVEPVWDTVPKHTRSQKAPQPQDGRDIETKTTPAACPESDVTIVPSQGDITIEKLSVTLLVDTYPMSADPEVCLERCLGIITGLDLDDPLLEYSRRARYQMHHPQGVLVQGLAANSPVSKVRIVIPGDVLVSIEGIRVSVRNIIDVLSTFCYPAEVEAVFERATTLSAPTSSAPMSSWLGLISGQGELDSKTLLPDMVAVYLTMDTPGTEPNDDILYRFPAVASTGQSIIDIRGCLLTLDDLLSSLMGTPLLSCSMTVGTELVNIVGMKVGRNLLLLISLEAGLELHTLKSIIHELEAELDFEFGSVTRAFLPINYHKLNRIFRIVFQCVTLHLDDHSSGTMMDGFVGARLLPLSRQKQVQFSEVLYDLEASDYGDFVDDFFPHRRLYIIVGTCLFYKGLLVSNHLPPEDLKGIVLFCKLHGLLALLGECRVRHLVIWREVFPAKSPPGQYPDAFQRPEGRHFLLIVAQKHTMLCILLESDGIAVKYSGFPRPHPYYVDTATSVLAFLQENIDFESLCESRLRGPPCPSLVSADSLAQTSQGPGGLSSSTQKEATQQRLGSNLEASRRISSSTENLRPLGNLDEDSVSPGGSILGYPTSQREMSFGDDLRDNCSATSFGKLSAKDSNYFSGSSGVTFPTALTLPDPDSLAILGLAPKLTAGISNVLFNYISFDFMRGVLLCPTTLDTSQLNLAISRNFQKACQVIRLLFNSTSVEHGSLSRQPVLEEFAEQGITFVCTARDTRESPRKPHLLPNAALPPSQAMKYCVVGRRSIQPTCQEFYACYHESIPQATVELAFKIGFGRSL